MHILMKILPHRNKFKAFLLTNKIHCLLKPIGEKTKIKAYFSKQIM